MPKRSLSPWTTSTGTSTASSSGRRLCGGLFPRPGGLSGKAEDGLGPSLIQGAAGDAGAERAPADDQRQRLEFIAPQALEHRDPRLVQTLGGCGGAAAGDAVGLLDERHGEALAPPRVACRDQVRRLDPAARSVTKDQRASGAVGGLQMRPRGAGRGFDLDGTQPEDLGGRNRLVGPGVLVAIRADEGEKAVEQGGFI